MPLLKKDGKLSGLTGFGIGKSITDKGMKEFADILSNGALPQLEVLSLYDNRIGDDGLLALADALSKGALAQLTRAGVRREALLLVPAGRWLSAPTST